MNLHRLDLASLSLFTLVVRTGSISQGAALAHLAIGAASRRITDLEAAVGVTLLERHSRGVLKEVEHLAADLSDYASGVVGVVRLWANTSAITQFLPRELSAFQARNPGIRIELEEQNSADIVLAVLDGRADFGIFADRTAAHGLDLLNYRSDRLVLVVPAGHPLQRRKAIRFAEVVDNEFVCLPRATSLSRRLHEETELLGRRLRVRIHVRSFDAMCQMVAAGMGVAVLPEAAIQPHLQSMHLRRIVLTDEWVHRQLLIGVRDAGTVTRPARLLIDHLCSGTTILGATATVEPRRAAARPKG